MSEYCEGIKFATKLVEIEATIIKKSTTTVICKLSNLPIISVGLVNIWLISSNFWFKNISEPTTIKTAAKEKTTKFTIKLNFLPKK